MKRGIFYLSSLNGIDYHNDWASSSSPWAHLPQWGPCWFGWGWAVLLHCVFACCTGQRTVMSEMVHTQKQYTSPLSCTLRCLLLLIKHTHTHTLKKQEHCSQEEKMTALSFQHSPITSPLKHRRNVCLCQSYRATSFIRQPSKATGPQASSDTPVKLQDHKLHQTPQ